MHFRAFLSEHGPVQAATGIRYVTTNKLLFIWKNGIFPVGHQAYPIHNPWVMWGHGFRTEMCNLVKS